MPSPPLLHYDSIMDNFSLNSVSSSFDTSLVQVVNETTSSNSSHNETSPLMENASNNADSDNSNNLRGESSSQKDKLPSSALASKHARLPLVSFNYAFILFLNAMLDSGAMTSCMSKETARRLRAQFPQHCILMKTTRTLRHAGSDPLTVICVARVTFQLSGKEFTWSFLVVDGLSSDIILGEDFHKAHIRSRHIQTNTLELLDGTHIPVYANTDEIRESYLKILGSHVVPPRTSVRISVHARKHIPHGNMTAFHSFARCRVSSALRTSTNSDSEPGWSYYYRQPFH